MGVPSGPPHREQNFFWSFDEYDEFGKCEVFGGFEGLAAMLGIVLSVRSPQVVAVDFCFAPLKGISPSHADADALHTVIYLRFPFDVIPPFALRGPGSLLYVFPPYGRCLRYSLLIPG